MKKQAITVTEAARNFADCVNRVRYQDATFVLYKNGEPVAQLVPTERKALTGHELAEALRKVQLAPEEAEAWSRDIREARERLLPPVNRWE